MEKRAWLRTALAILASIAGTGYASGRELVVFFAQTGRAAWMGVPFASAVFGLLMGCLCRLAARQDAASLDELWRRLLGPRAARAAGLAHGLLLGAVAAAMLCQAGRIGALTLPLRRGFLWGVALTLAVALSIGLAKTRPLYPLGFLLLAAGLVYYAALAIDPRPPRLYLSGEVELALKGSASAAVLLGLTYAALNACLAAPVAVRFGRCCARPARVGTLCAVMLCALLLCANAAIARGGEALLAQALPMVLLSARWGLSGFWLQAAFCFLCATTTLSAALYGLAGRFQKAK